MTHNGRNVFIPDLVQGCMESLSSVLATEPPDGDDATLIKSFMILAYKWAADVAMTTLEVGPSM
jgi:hypothetical protein